MKKLKECIGRIDRATLGEFLDVFHFVGRFFTAGAHSLRLRPGHSGEDAFTPAAPKKFGRAARRVPSPSGRSMLEMLGVLAIIGVLSVAALVGFTYAMNKHRANETIYDVMLRGTNVPMIDEYYYNKASGYEFRFPGLVNNGRQGAYYPMTTKKDGGSSYYVEATGVTYRVCELILKMNPTDIDQIVVGNTVYQGDSDICGDTDGLAMKFCFGEDGTICDGTGHGGSGSGSGGTSGSGSGSGGGSGSGSGGDNPDPTPCTLSKDCTGTLVCINGTCQEPETNEPCTTDEDCLGDQTCTSGSCQKPTPCTTSTDCDGNLTCTNGECKNPTPCTTDTECPGELVCTNGICQDPVPCTEDTDCPGDLICTSGTCTDPECTIDGDCVDIETCTEGRCKPKPCTDNTVCGTGGCCKDGICTSNCTCEERGGETIYYLKGACCQEPSTCCSLDDTCVQKDCTITDSTQCGVFCTEGAQTTSVCCTAVSIDGDDPMDHVWVGDKYGEGYCCASKSESPACCEAAGETWNNGTCGQSCDADTQHECTNGSDTWCCNNGQSCGTTKGQCVDCNYSNPPTSQTACEACGWEWTVKWESPVDPDYKMWTCGGKKYCSTWGVSSYTSTSRCYNCLQCPGPGDAVSPNDSNFRLTFDDYSDGWFNYNCEYDVYYPETGYTGGNGYMLGCNYE